MNYAVNVDTTEVTKFSNIANHWWELNGPCAPLHILNPIRLQFIQQHTQLENKSVLDVGCGAGILTESIAKLGANITGIDASSEVISVATEHASISKLEINYSCTTIEAFNPQQQFDIITCMELIEHVPDPYNLIHDCAKLLQPGGKFFLSTLNRTPKAYALAILGAEYILNILPKQTHDYKKFLRPDELDAILRSANLKLQVLDGVSYQPFTKTAKLTSDLSVNYLAYAIKDV